jgi:hypothetical protein
MARSKTNTLPDDIILNLEARLAGTLKPIRPSNDIVQRLRARIRFPAREEIVSRLGDWKKMFLVFGGVMSGLLLVITLARAFFYFLGRRQM